MFRLALIWFLLISLAAPVAPFAAAQIATCGPGQSGTKSNFAGGAGAACVVSCPANTVQTPRNSAGACCLRSSATGDGTGAIRYTVNDCRQVGSSQISNFDTPTSTNCSPDGATSFFASRVFACTCHGQYLRTDNSLGSACILRSSCPVANRVEASGGRDPYCNRAPAGTDTDTDTDTETPAPGGGGGGGGETGGGLFSTVSGWTAGIVGAFRSALGWALDLFVQNVWPYFRDAAYFVGEYVAVGFLLGLDALWDTVGLFVYEHIDWIWLVVAGVLAVWLVWEMFGRVGKKLVDLGMEQAWRLFFLATGSATILLYLMNVFFSQAERAALGSGISAAAFNSVFNVGYTSGPLQSLLAGMYTAFGFVSADTAAVLSASHAGFLIYMLHLFWVGPGLKVLFLAYFLRFVIRRFTLSIQLAGG